MGFLRDPSRISTGGPSTSGLRIPVKRAKSCPRRSHDVERRRRRDGESWWPRPGGSERTPSWRLPSRQGSSSRSSCRRRRRCWSPDRSRQPRTRQSVWTSTTSPTPSPSSPRPSPLSSPAPSAAPGCPPPRSSSQANALTCSAQSATSPSVEKRVQEQTDLTIHSIFIKST